MKLMIPAKEKTQHQYKISSTAAST